MLMSFISDRDIYLFKNYFVFIFNLCERREREQKRKRAQENVHVRQSFWFTPQMSATARAGPEA